MTRTEKEQFIADLHDRFSRAQATLAVQFSGLSVGAATELRKRMRDGGVEYRVIKNTLAKRAAEETDVAPLSEVFTGPTAVVLSYEDVVAPAKILYGFLKGNEDKLQVKGGVVQGKHVSVQEVEALSKMPGLEELRAKILQTINAPAQTLMRLLNTPGEQLARVVHARSEQAE